MPSKYKNDTRRAHLWRFTNHVEMRKVFLVDGIEYSKLEVDMMLSNLTIDVNYLIQELNLLVSRNIPYISLEGTNKIDDKMRILLRDGKEDSRQAAYIFLDNIPYNITHLLDFKIIAVSPRLKESEFKNTDAKITIDSSLTKETLADIFLDVSMFNSYSFLNCFTVEERKKFNIYKVEYAKNQKLKSYINVNYDDNFGYFSFALACRNNNTYEFDVEKYISIWDDFINKYYGNRSHIEPEIKEQILHRVDYNHIPNNYEKEFDIYSPGVYFILRLNRHNVSSKFKKFLCTEFGIPKISVGPLKIVAANDMKRFNEVCRLGYIAAFKIVKQ